MQQKIGDYFAACMDTAAIDAARLRSAEAGAWREWMRWNAGQADCGDRGDCIMSFRALLFRIGHAAGLMRTSNTMIAVGWAPADWACRIATTT